jgi:hypothetical protein
MIDSMADFVWVGRNPDLDEPAFEQIDVERTGR